jgi:hypothetical protein
LQIYRGCTSTDHFSFNPKRSEKSQVWRAFCKSTPAVQALTTFFRFLSTNPNLTRTQTRPCRCRALALQNLTRSGRAADPRSRRDPTCAPPAARRLECSQYGTRCRSLQRAAWRRQPHHRGGGAAQALVGRRCQHGLGRPTRSGRVPSATARETARSRTPTVLFLFIVLGWGLSEGRSKALRPSMR